MRDAAVVTTQGGCQWMGDLVGCACPTALLTDVHHLRDLCVSAVHGSGLTMVCESFHQFEAGGATGVVVLAESHLAVHTWPEIGFVTIDLYVCNVRTDNSIKAAALFRELVDAFAPSDARQQRMERGA